MRKKILIALGGNALGQTVSSQKKAVHIAAAAITNLTAKGYNVVICHGNGPQVGLINNAFEHFLQAGKMSEPMPFPECGAMSQGYIGFHLQNAIRESLVARNLDFDVATIITQTKVNRKDPAFAHPTKPIGSFMTKDVAQTLAAKHQISVAEDAGRGWRRVVPSPRPVDIIEKDLIKKLLDQDTLIIAGGGGGIPVYEDKNQLIGIDAVVDKDFTAAKLAAMLDVDHLVILTAVDHVKINFGKPDEEALTEMNLQQLMQLVAQNQFAPGSMLPKILAAQQFVNTTKRTCYIGSLVDADKIVSGTAGTKIVP